MKLLAQRSPLAPVSRQRRKAGEILLGFLSCLQQAPYESMTHPSDSIDWEKAEKCLFGGPIVWECSTNEVSSVLETYMLYLLKPACVLCK